MKNKNHGGKNMNHVAQQPKLRTAQAPAELWNEDTAHPFALVRRDRLEITGEMVEQAEHPELKNFWIGRLPAAGAGRP